MAKFTRAEIRKIVGEACTNEIEDALVALHLGVVDPLKEEVDKYKADAGKPAELEELKKKYDAEHTEYEAFKKKVAEEKALAAKQEAYKAIAKDAGLSDKGVEKALKYASWDKVELDDEGKVKNAGDHVTAVKDEWSEYVVKTDTVGAKTATPPASKPSSTVLSKSEIYKKDEHGRYVLSAAERQEALAKILNEEGKQ